MSDATAQIRVDIVATGAESGANRVNAALDKINGKSRSVGAANDNLAGTFDKIGKSMSSAAGHGGVLGSVFDEIRNKAAGATPEVGGLLSELAGMGPMAAVIGTVALAIGALAAKSIEAAKQTQLWQANLLTVTKSTEGAKSAYAGLVNFANSTPFTLGQSVEGFIKLRALGLATSKDIMTSYGNTAAAMGKNMSQMIEAVADATTGEFERLKEFGIKAKQSGDNVAFTFQGVTTSVKKNSKEIQDYIVGIGKTNFGGAMDRQMATISGAFSNLEDKAFLAFAAIGEGQLGKSIANIANQIADGVGTATPVLRALGDILGGIVSVVWSIGTAFAQMTSGLVTNTDNGYSAIEKLSVVLSFIGQGISVVGSIAGSVFGFIGQVVGTTASYINAAFGQVFSWFVPSFQSTGQSAGESLVGILRAAQFVANQLPNIFKAALNEIKGAFISAGQALAKSLTGDFSGWGKVDLSLKNTQKAMAATWQGAKATYGNQKANRAWIDNAAGRGAAGNIDYKALGQDKNAGKGKKDSGASDAEKKAKAEAEFWKTLQGEVDTAKLLPVEAENYRKQLELQKILGRDINAAEKARLADLLQQARIAKLLTGLAVDHQKAFLDIADQEALLTLRRAGASENQLDVEKAVLDKRAAAIIAGATQADLQTDAWKAAEAQLRADLARLGILKDQNKALDDQLAKVRDMANDGYSYAKAAVETHGTIGAQRAAANTKYEDRKRNLLAAWVNPQDGKRMSTDEFNAGMKKAVDEFKDKMAEIGTDFERKVGRAANLLSEIGDRLGGKLGAFLNKLGSIGDSIGNFDKTKNGIADQFNEIFGGSKSKFVQGMGKAVGGAVAGAEIGKNINSALAPIGKALGFKSSQTGAQLGGALGGAFFGPIGAAIGSVAGSILGGLLKKTKYGTAVLTGSGDPTVKGNSSSTKKGATGAAGSVQDALSQLASSLGGTVGDYNVSIGQVDGKWRVSTTGRSGKLKKSYSDVSAFGKDGEADAIQFAIEDAIKDGAIKGLSPLVQNALQKLSQDAAIKFAQDWTAAMDDYKSMIDPVGAAVDAIIKPLDSLKKTMLEVGASSENMANFEAYRAKKLDAAFKDQVSGFQELLDDLTGDAGGVSALTQLNTNMAKLGSYQNDLAAGKTINQDDFTVLAQKIMGNAGDVYGTNTAQYQDVVSKLTGITNSAITNATGAFNSAVASSTTTAIVDQTNAVTAQIGISNDYLRQIAAAVSGGMYVPAAANGNSVGVSNGRATQAF
jgi:hypothetical protein